MQPQGQGGRIGLRSVVPVPTPRGPHGTPKPRRVVEEHGLPVWSILGFHVSMNTLPKANMDPGRMVFL